MWTKKTNNGIKPHSLMKGKSSGMFWMAAGVVALLCGRAAGELTFGTPQNLGPTINSSARDVHPWISSDGLELYFASDRPGGYGSSDIWKAMRETTDEPWKTPINLGLTINGSYKEEGPTLSADGLSLYFSSTRPGGYGNWDIWVSVRANKSLPWSMPVNLGTPVNSNKDEYAACLSLDGLEMFICEQTVFRPGYGEGDIYVMTRASVSDPWGEPKSLGSTVNSAYFDSGMGISPDRLTLFFGSMRPGGIGPQDLYVTTRASIHDPWTTPVNLGVGVNSTGYDAAPKLSTDGSTLYFISSRFGGYGGYDLWEVSVFSGPVCGDLNHPYPLSDLNKDCRVDLLDFAIFCNQWLQDNNP